MLRDEIAEMVKLAERLDAVGMTAVLSTLFSANGSSYRPLGSMMVSGPGSELIAGGISGGCLEEYVARRGRQLVEQYPATMLSFQTDPDGDHDGVPTLGCGGSIEVLVERFTPEHLEFLRQFHAAHLADHCATAACVIDTEPQPSIDVRRMMWADGEANQPENSRLEALRQCAIAEERSQQAAIGGSRRALIHYVAPLRRMVVFGAGNDARPLCTLARSLGWHVTVGDRRGRLATRARFSEADHIVAADWRSGIGQITFTPHTAVVVMTHSLADDIELLPLLAEKPMAYLGVLGPEHRRRWLLQGIEETASVSEAFTGRIRSPIGLNLGDRSATGIAVSIVSEILAELNGRVPAPLSQQTVSPKAIGPDCVGAHA